MPPKRRADGTYRPFIRNATPVEEAVADLLAELAAKPSRKITIRYILGKQVDVDEQQTDAEWVETLEFWIEQVKGAVTRLQRAQLLEQVTVLVRR